MEACYFIVIIICSVIIIGSRRFKMPRAMTAAPTDHIHTKSTIHPYLPSCSTPTYLTREYDMYVCTVSVRRRRSSDSHAHCLSRSLAPSLAMLPLTAATNKYFLAYLHEKHDRAHSRD